MTVWENKKCCGENTARIAQVSVDSFLEFSKLSSVLVCVTRKHRPEFRDTSGIFYTTQSEI